MADLIANSLRIYTGREAGLLAYYRMNEGKGDEDGQIGRAQPHVWRNIEYTRRQVAFFNGKDAIAVVNSSRVAIT